MWVRVRSRWVPALLVGLTWLGAGCAGRTRGGPDPAPVRPSADPGRVTIHRLNRFEYNNTVRDLLGTKLRPADAFPPDDHAYGFDNNADILRLGPVQLLLYEKAAETLVDEVLARPVGAGLLVCDSQRGLAACHRRILSAFVPLAWRRSVSEDELERLLAIGAAARAAGAADRAQLRAMLEAVLLSPHFLFRTEIDPDPTSLDPRPLDDFELASRLSYFLWSSMPDAALLDAAAAGRLRTSEQVRAQVERMVADPKITAFAESFGGQWLFSRAVLTLDSDNTNYKKLLPYQLSMFAEATRFLADLVARDRPVAELLTANYSFLDDRLAEHYGIGPIGAATELRRFAFAGPERGGLLGQGALLAATSFPTRTSPTKRGAWIVTQLLCTPPPPPPAGVPALVDKGSPEGGTLRERLEDHRSDVSCAACHRLFDGMGFALESFDFTGRHRTTDGTGPIDDSATLPGGREVRGRAQLAEALADDPRFIACAVKNLYTYALGRGPEALDRVPLQRLVGASTARTLTFKALLIAVATSEPFRFRRGEPGGQR